MTAEELAEEHIGLLFQFAKIKGIVLDSCDDYYGILAEGFWKACLTFNPENKCKFSTYAFKIMNNFMVNNLVSQTRNVRKINSEISTSLDKTQDTDNTEEEFNLYNIVGTDGFEDDVVNRLYNLETIKRVFEVATDAQRDYLELFYSGLKNSEVARALNVTPAVIHERRNDLRKRLARNGITYEC